MKVRLALENERVADLLCRKMECEIIGDPMPKKVISSP